MYPPSFDRWLLLVLRSWYVIADVDYSGRDEAEDDGEADADEELVVAAYVEGGLSLLDGSLLFSVNDGHFEFFAVSPALQNQSFILYGLPSKLVLYKGMSEGA